MQDLKPSAFITKEVGQASIQVRNLFVPIILNISPTSIPDVYPYSIQIDLYDAGSNLLRGVQFDGCVLVEVETVDPPRLTFSLRGPPPSLILSWPNRYSDFRLEAASAVSGPWSDVPEPPQVQGDQLTVEVLTATRFTSY